jgi:mannose/fructose/N-acetylgalactosamine-specific phosphotransferase system component IIB
VGIVLFRVDERLIHGQVAVGWGGRFHPTRYVVVDDPLRESDWEQELYRLGTPPEAVAEFQSVEEARGRIPAWEESLEVTFLLTRTVAAMHALAAGGTLRGRQVNLGGIHHSPGRRKVLPYLFLDAGDASRLEDLRAEGVEVVAQDLPSSACIPLDRILGG